MKVETHLILKRGLSTWTLTLAASLRKLDEAGAPSPGSRPRPRTVHAENTASTDVPCSERYGGARAPGREDPANPRARAKKLLDLLLWVLRLASYLANRGGVC